MGFGVVGFLVYDLRVTIWIKRDRIAEVRLRKTLCLSVFTPKMAVHGNCEGFQLQAFASQRLGPAERSCAEELAGRMRRAWTAGSERAVCNRGPTRGILKSKRSWPEECSRS